MQNNVIATINLLHMNTVIEMYLGQKAVSLNTLEPEAKKKQRGELHSARNQDNHALFIFYFFLIRNQKYYLLTKKRTYKTELVDHKTTPRQNE